LHRDRVESSGNAFPIVVRIAVFLNRSISAAYFANSASSPVTPIDRRSAIDADAISLSGEIALIVNSSVVAANANAENVTQSVNIAAIFEIFIDFSSKIYLSERMNLALLAVNFS